ncbi:DUF2007 domain-containing protein [Puniceicoccaceae bacterium K14]|nr:DUF2007 domain-containing protein [Puniceicoccaceae bacterium K14]
MKQVYTHMDFTHVGHFQSVLEGEGIQTTVRNKNASGVMGEIPFTEVWPELWVLNDSDEEKAQTIIKEFNSSSKSRTAAWTCPKCDSEVDEGFSECWNCGNPAN